MNEINIKDDILLICKEALNFPEGVPATFKELESELSNIAERKCFGIYREKKKKINYHAAFSAFNTENINNTELSIFTIEKGNYLGITINEWFKKIECIGETFCKLFEDDRVDPNSASIEAYEGNNLVCMVKMK